MQNCQLFVKTTSIHNIPIAFLDVCPFCPINAKTAKPIGPKLCVGPHMTPGKVYGFPKLKKCPSRFKVS